MRCIFDAISRNREFCLPGGRVPTYLPEPGPLGDADYFQCATSGSSGPPKRVRRAHASWIASFEINRALWDLGPRDSYAVLGDLGQSLTLYAALEALHVGADLSLLCGQRPDRQFAALARNPPSILYATPAQFIRLADCRGPRPIARTRQILVGGAALTPAARASMQALFPSAAITVFYGAAETSFVTMADRHTPPGSVGRPYPGVELEIRDPAGRLAGTGAIGEIWVKSPYLFESYAQGTAPDTVWRNGFLTVGELGSCDALGNLTLAGRKNRMFTVADQNVFPEEVEQYLLAQPGVAHAAVLPRPDLKRGQVPVAFVSGAITGNALDRLLRTSRRDLGPLSAPRGIRLLDDWPLLASGKTDLAALKKALGAMAP